MATVTDQQTHERASKGRIAGITIAIILSLGLITLLTLGLVREPERLNLDHRFTNGEQVIPPDFTLPIFANGGRLGPDGTPVTLSKLRGTPVVVNFWASWCAPCHDEAPILQDLQRRFGDRVVFLTVNSEDGPDEARAFLKRYHATFPVVRTGQDTIRRSYGTNQMPETFVIDPDGALGMQPFRGGIDVESASEIADHLTRVLAQ